MTSDRKYPGVAFWTTVALVAVLGLMAYPVSTGPADWGRNHGFLSEGMVDGLDWFYSPLPWSYEHRPAFIQRAICWYGNNQSLIASPSFLLLNRPPHPSGLQIPFFESLRRRSELA